MAKTTKKLACIAVAVSMVLSFPAAAWADAAASEESAGIGAVSTEELSGVGAVPVEEPSGASTDVADSEGGDKGADGGLAASGADGGSEPNGADAVVGAGAAAATAPGGESGASEGDSAAESAAAGSQRATTSLKLDFSGIDFGAGRNVVDVDGVSYPLKDRTVTLPLPADAGAAARFVTFYTYQKAGDVAAYENYPVNMYVWQLSYNEKKKEYTASRLTSFDNALKYAGCSVRTLGNAGIRVVTEVPKAAKASLTGKGLNGYTLLEYGTAVQWDDVLESSGQSLTLDTTKMSSYAYKRGVADPIYKETANGVKYTAVLVNFPDENIGRDLSIRPYMKLRDAKGNDHVLYGGVLHRSVGYVASQNADEFGKGTLGYNFIWHMIHAQYGTSLDAELGYVDWNILAHVPEVLQNPELPWGCESVSLVIALRAMGYDVGKTEIYDSYLSHSTWDFVNAYAGDSYALTGIGEAFPPAIVDAANRYLVQHGARERAVNLSGASFDTLLEYIDKGYPVLVWTTMYMQSYRPMSLSLYGYNAYANEHCVVMYGHSGGIQVSDPLSGKVTRDWGAFESLYNRCGRYAVVIV